MKDIDYNKLSKSEKARINALAQWAAIPKEQRSRKGVTAPNWQGGISSPKHYFRRMRKATLEALGGKCVYCGFSDFRALQIDHINGGGSKERKTRNYVGNFHTHVLRSFMNKENKYQLLCANCNWIKRAERDERNPML